MFRKVNINNPLLDAIKQVHRYAKFVKELCTSKKKLKGNGTKNLAKILLQCCEKGCIQSARIRIFLVSLINWETLKSQDPC